MKRFYLFCLLSVFANTCIAMQNDLEVIRGYVREPIQSSEILAPVGDLINHLLQDKNTKLYTFIDAKYTEDRKFKQPFKKFSYEDILCNMFFDESFCDGIFQKYLQQNNLCALLLAFLYYELFVFQDILDKEDRVLEHLAKKECHGYARFTEREMISDILERIDRLIEEDCSLSGLEEFISQQVMFFKNQLIQLWNNRLLAFSLQNVSIDQNRNRGERVSSVYSDFCDASWVLQVIEICKTSVKNSNNFPEGLLSLAT